MAILEVKNITFEYQDEGLLKDVSFQLFHKEHACLIGSNGAGKSTLLKMFNKQLSPDNGTVELLPTIKVGYLDQYATIDNEKTLEEYLYETYYELFLKEEKMNSLYESIAYEDQSKHDKILNYAQKIQDELLNSKFYQIKSEIGNIMSGLGLDLDLLTKQIKVLSGGMRAKLILGKLLLDEADFLLLDEPTNFLDIKHIDWLASFLNKYDGTFIVVSHDISFVGKIAKVILAIENKQITKYRGGYDFYLKERELRIEQYTKEYLAQKKLITKTEEFINKNLTRATTTKRAQSRRKMLEKMTVLDRPVSEKDAYFNFLFSSPTGKEVLITKDLVIGYKEPLLEPISATILKEESVVITGKNGVGKSTFLKTILSIIPSIDGSFKWIDTVKIGYFEQESHLDIEKTPYEIVKEAYEYLDQKGVYSLLAQSGLTRDMIVRKISTLSGGEKTKVRLALLRKEKYNCLVFDEPTNHLDQRTIKALKESLIRFEGTVIIVSHDKNFYNDICDKEISFL